MCKGGTSYFFFVKIFFFFINERKIFVAWSRVSQQDNTFKNNKININAVFWCKFNYFAATYEFAFSDLKMRLGDTAQRKTLARWVLRYDAYCGCDHGCLPGESRNPSLLLTLKYTKRIRTRCVNCRKVVQLDGITKGDGHAGAESV